MATIQLCYRKSRVQQCLTRGAYTWPFQMNGKSTLLPSQRIYLVSSRSIRHNANMLLQKLIDLKGFQCQLESQDMTTTSSVIAGRRYSWRSEPQIYNSCPRFTTKLRIKTSRQMMPSIEPTLNCRMRRSTFSKRRQTSNKSSSAKHLPMDSVFKKISTRKLELDKHRAVKVSSAPNMEEVSERRPSS